MRLISPQPETSGPTRSPRRHLITACVAAALVLTMTLSACGSGQADDTANETPGAETSTTEAAPATTTAGPSTTIDAIGTGDPSSPLEDPEATGRELAQRFLDVLSSPNPTAQLEEFLSPAFQLQRSNGTFANRDEYLEQPASVSRFEILDDNFRAYQDGPVLTVRFSIAITETIDGTELRVSEANRLGVFLRSDAGWKLVAWSNFNPVIPES